MMMRYGTRRAALLLAVGTLAACGGGTGDGAGDATQDLTSKANPAATVADKTPAPTGDAALLRGSWIIDDGSSADHGLVLRGDGTFTEETVKTLDADQHQLKPGILIAHAEGRYTLTEKEKSILFSYTKSTKLDQNTQKFADVTPLPRPKTFRYETSAGSAGSDLADQFQPPTLQLTEEGSASDVPDSTRYSHIESWCSVDADCRASVSDPNAGVWMSIDAQDHFVPLDPAAAMAEACGSGKTCQAKCGVGQNACFFDKTTAK
jgi:hypothetical protein